MVLRRLDAAYAAWRGGGLDGVFDGIGSRNFLFGRRVKVADGRERAAIARDGRLEVSLGHGQVTLVESGEVDLVGA